MRPHATRRPIRAKQALAAVAALASRGLIETIAKAAKSLEQKEAPPGGGGELCGRVGDEVDQAAW